MLRRYCHLESDASTDGRTGTREQHVTMLDINLQNIHLNLLSWTQRKSKERTRYDDFFPDLRDTILEN